MEGKPCTSEWGEETQLRVGGGAFDIKGDEAGSAFIVGGGWTVRGVRVVLPRENKKKTMAWQENSGVWNKSALRGKRSGRENKKTPITSNDGQKRLSGAEIHVDKKTKGDYHLRVTQGDLAGKKKRNSWYKELKKTKLRKTNKPKKTNQKTKNSSTVGGRREEVKEMCEGRTAEKDCHWTERGGGGGEKKSLKKSMSRVRPIVFQWKTKQGGRNVGKSDGREILLGKWSEILSWRGCMQFKKDATLGLGSGQEG